MKLNRLVRAGIYTILVGVSTCPRAVQAGNNDIIRVATRPVIVNAYDGKQRNLPDAQTTVLTEKEISADNYKSVEDVLRQINGVVINSMIPGATSFVKLNGDDRVNILVDGQNIGNAQGSSYGRGTVDLGTLPGVDSIAEIEVVKGGSSVRYGAGAVGGTINIVTKKGKKNRTVFDLSTGSWKRHRYGLTQEGSAGNTSWMVAGSLEKREYYKFPNAFKGDEARGDFSAKNISARIDQRLSKSDSLTFNLFHKTYRGHAVTFDSGYSVNHNEFKIKAIKPLERLVNNYSLTYHFGENTGTPGFIRYFNDYTRTRWTNRFHTRTQGVQAETSWMNAHHFVTAGLEWTKDAGSNDGANYKDRKKTNRAVYVEDMTVFNKWTITPCLRLDDNSNFGFHKTPRLAVEYRASGTFNAYASWSRVYTAPRLNDMYYNGARSHGDPNLRPETGYSQTLGFDWAFDKKSVLRFSAFHSYLNDAIRWDRSVTPYQVRNLNREDKRGIDISLQKKVNAAWDYEAGYSYTKTKIDERRGMRLDPSNSSPNGYHAALRYHAGKWRANLMITAGTGRNDSYYMNRSYIRWDANASYVANADTTFYMTVQNIGDDGYDLYHGYPDAGRNWSFGVKYAF